MADEVTPRSFEDAAATLAEAAAGARAVRFIGGGTKLGWGERGAPPGLILHTSALDQTIEHNAGDLTAVYAAGAPLARIRSELAAAGQMLAVDPPLGPQGQPAATIGGVFATGDSGPLRHRYGQPRDLILGITVALSDGTVARAGGKVIKNVAGYDLAKLFTGSFGTLGLILSVSVRLHPLPDRPATALGQSTDPSRLGAAAIALARAPLELEALDVAWRHGRGGLLAQVAGVQARRRAARVASVMQEAGLERVEVTTEDEALWARQRAGQRSSERAVMRVAARRAALPELLRAADACGATLTGRAGFGESYLELDPAGLGELRRRLPPETTAVVLDRPEGEAWPEGDAVSLELMRSVKRRFDPAGVCNPGVFVGGI